MKHTLAALFSTILLMSFAQTSNFIEVAVEETIELRAKTVTVHISVDSEYEQRERLYREEFDYTEHALEEYSEEYYYESEEDWMYEDMLENSPKKVTREMTKEYEERQRKRKEREELREQREKDFEKKWENHKKVRAADVSAIFRELKLKTAIVKRTNERYEEYYDEYEEYQDSIVEVTVTSSEEWEQLLTTIIDLPVEMDLDEVVHQSADDQLTIAVPKLSQRAKNQAQLIATSVGRKLGKVIECTNIYPFTPSKTYLGTYSNELERMLFRNEHEGGNPFESSKKEIIQLIYKFELLN